MGGPLGIFDGILNRIPGLIDAVSVMDETVVPPWMETSSGGIRAGRLGSLLATRLVLFSSSIEELLLFVSAADVELWEILMLLLSPRSA